MSPLLAVRSGPSVDREVPPCTGRWRGSGGKECLPGGEGDALTSEGGAAVSTLKADSTPQPDRAARRVGFVVCGLYRNKAAVNRRTWRRRYRKRGVLVTERRRSCERELPLVS